MKPETLTAHELHNLLSTKKLSAVELAEAVLARIEKVEDQVKAYVTLTKEETLKPA